MKVELPRVWQHLPSVSEMGNRVLNLYWLFLRIGRYIPPHFEYGPLVSYSLGGTGFLASFARSRLASREVCLTGEPVRPEFPVRGYMFPQQPAHQKMLFRGKLLEAAVQSTGQKAWAVGFA